MLTVALIGGFIAFCLALYFVSTYLFRLQAARLYQPINGFLAADVAWQTMGGELSMRPRVFWIRANATADHPDGVYRNWTGQWVYGHTANATALYCGIGDAQMFSDSALSHELAHCYRLQAGGTGEHDDRHAALTAFGVAALKARGM
jgi:hypothetical protein